MPLPPRKTHFSKCLQTLCLNQSRIRFRRLEELCIALYPLPSPQLLSLSNNVFDFKYLIFSGVIIPHILWCHPRLILFLFPVVVPCHSLSPSSPCPLPPSSSRSSTTFSAPPGMKHTPTYLQKQFTPHAERYHSRLSAWVIQQRELVDENACCEWGGLNAGNGSNGRDFGEKEHSI